MEFRSYQTELVTGVEDAAVVVYDDADEDNE